MEINAYYFIAELHNNKYYIFEYSTDGIVINTMHHFDSLYSANNFIHQQMKKQIEGN